MSDALREELDRLVEVALAEDVGDGDRTTDWTVPRGSDGVARIVARAHGLVSGVGFADRVFERVDPDVRRQWHVSEGDRVEHGDVLVELTGPLASILTAERSALNGLARLSGIATETARYVDAIAGTGARLVDTRKTTPGWRHLEKAATRAGGAENHRLGLYDMVLIKENHIRASGGISAALAAVADGARAEGLQVEIEVDTLAELDEALEARPDRVLLDNMTTAELRQAVERVNEGEAPRPLLEASGGIDLASVRTVAETGVDIISVGAITHSAPSLDLSLLVDR